MCRRTFTDDFDFPAPPRIPGVEVDPPNFLHPTSTTWHEATRTKKTQDIRQALDFQGQLEVASRSLASIESSAASNDANELAEHVAKIASATAGLRQFWSKMVSTHLYNEQRATTGAARRVFDVPELLERILTFVGRRELLIVQQVDRTMHDAIQGSVKLARKLHLVPNATGHLETPFSKSRKYRYRSCHPGNCRRSRTSPFYIPGLKCYSMPRMPRSHHSPTETPNDPDSHRCRTIVATVRPPRPDAPEIGSRCRKMLVCNPPITKMEIYPHCCAYQHYEHDFVYGGQYAWAFPPPPPPPVPVLPVVGGPLAALPPPPPPPMNPINHFQAPVPHPRPAIEPIYNKSGITVGDLLDATSKLGKSHRLCPFASSGHHDAEGNVKVVVQFAATIKLKEDDPIIKPLPMFPLGDNTDPFQFNPSYQAPLSPSDPASHSATLNRYITAKRNAFDEGRPIPTFDEFKLAEAEPEGLGMSTDAFAALVSSQQQSTV